MSDYAILSASSSSRWINCPPSVRLNHKYKEETSIYAIEGSCAHSLGENKINKRLGRKADLNISDLDFYNEEMEEYTTDYANFVMEEISKVNDPIVLVEQKLDLSSFAKESFGTADCIIVSEKTVHVIDMKYEMGVLVDANNNTQLMLYGLGALNLFEGIYDIETVKLIIFQPRRENISSFEISVDDLYKWDKEVVMPMENLAYNGEGEFKVENWCKFCKAKNTCRKRAEYCLEIVKDEFKNPDELEDYEIEKILKRVDEVESFISDIKSYALELALKGKKWEGFKLVEGRSSRRYINEKSVINKVKEMGLDPSEKKILRITAMTKLVGKTKFEKELGDLLIKPKGKPTLVKDSDKRKELNIETVQDEFKEEI